MSYRLIVGLLLGAVSSVFAVDTAIWKNTTGNGLWNDAANWDVGRVPDLNYQVRIEAYDADVTIDVGETGACPYKIYLPSGNRHRVILTGTGSYTHASGASSTLINNNGKSLVEFRCPFVAEKDLSLSFGVVFKGEVTVNTSKFVVTGSSQVYDETTQDYLRCEIHGKLDMPNGAIYAAADNGNCKLFIEEGAEVTANSIQLGTNGWIQVNGGHLTVNNRIVSSNYAAGHFGPRFVQTGGRTTCTHNDKPVSLYAGIFELQGGVFETPCSGTVNDGIYIRRTGEGNGVIISGGELHTSLVNLVYPDSNFFSFTGGSLYLAINPTYTYPYELTGAAGTTVVATGENAEFRPLHNDGESATLDSVFYVTNGVKASFYLPYSGTFALSGSGTIFANRFYSYSGGGSIPAYLNVSGLAINLGPGTNNCSAAGSSLNLSGGASIGAFGADEDAWAGQQITLGIDGVVGIRTTDAIDGTTPRRISSFKTSFDEAAELTISGNGAFEANLVEPATFKSLALTDTARLVLGAGYGLEVESLALATDVKIEVRVPADCELAAINVLTAGNLPEDLTDHLVVSGEGAEGFNVNVSGNSVVLYREAEAEGVEWTGRGGDNKWSTAANWNGNILPQTGDAVAFGGIRNLVVENDSDIAPSNIWFRSSAGAFTIGGNPITISAFEPNYGAGHVEEAAIRNSSSFAQTFDTHVTLTGHYANLWCDDVQPIIFNKGFTKEESVLYLHGTVMAGGTSTIKRYLRFYKSGTSIPSCLHVQEGGNLTIKQQANNSFSDYNNPGRLVIDAGGTLTIDSPGRLEFRDPETIEVNGTLNINGHFMADVSDTTFSGTGTVFIAETHSSSHSSTNKFKHFIGTDGLTLRLGGNWTTVDDFGVSAPSNACALSLHDASKLVLAADCTYGPKAGVEVKLSTPADRVATFKGTVTVDTAGHTLTFVDPLSAASATLVKVGEGRIVLSADSTVRDLTISNGCVRPATYPLAVSGTLTLSETGTVDADAAILKNWTDLATASEIVAPAEDWTVGTRRYRVVTRAGAPVLQGRNNSGVTIIFR